MFCFSRANHASTNLKQLSSSKLDKFTLFTHSFVGWILENRYKEGVSIFFRIRISENIFLQNKNWLRVQDFVDKTLRLVRISLLISAIQRVLRFSSGNLFYKSNRKLFSCVCIAWYKYSRRWENSRQLCKPETKSCLYQAMQTLTKFNLINTTYPIKDYSIECFHMTSRRPYWCPKSILWELNSFLRQLERFLLFQ